MAVAGDKDKADQPDRPTEWVRPRDAVTSQFPMPPDDQRRPGPELLPADSWGVSQSTSDEYEGRHHTKDRRNRLWLGIAIVLVGLTAAVGLPFAFVSSPDPDEGAALPLDGPPATVGEAETGQALSTNFSPQASPTPTVSPSPSVASPQAPPVVPPTTKPPTTTPPPPPPFAAVTFEAEAGGSRTSLGGSARTMSYEGASGGRIVRNLGNWGMSGGPGTLQLNGLVIPSNGTYRLTIYFVHPDNETNRSAVITVSGVAPVTVAFTGNSTCCANKVVNIAIPAGTRTITVTNSTGRAPSIDRIVITRP